ncbi:hypothetical protein AB0G79_25490 [Streptomyces sp. NPDC020807]
MTVPSRGVLSLTRVRPGPETAAGASGRGRYGTAVREDVVPRWW